MMRRLGALAVVLMVLPAAARGEQTVRVAIYAPNAAFVAGTDRHSFVTHLAEQITAAAGVHAEGKAWVRAADFEAAVKKKEVDFAVLDGVYLAERNVPYTVLATAAAGGETASRWALFSATATGLHDLQGGKLVLPATGPRDVAFVENALLDSELQVAKFFAADRLSPPDVSSAVTAVSLKKADAVFAPDGQGNGLKKLYESRASVPYPAFCAVDGNLTPELVAKVKRAVLEHGAGGAVYDSWRASSGEAYRTLAGRMAVHSRRPVMVEPEVVRIDDLDLLGAPSIEWALPDVKPLFQSP
jgi:ABC-type amino acid transport substrate-binding protein